MTIDEYESKWYDEKKWASQKKKEYEYGGTYVVETKLFIPFLANTSSFFPPLSLLHLILLSLTQNI